jgi:hypothetical protein
LIGLVLCALFVIRNKRFYDIKCFNTYLCIIICMTNKAHNRFYYIKHIRVLLYYASYSFCSSYVSYNVFHSFLYMLFYFAIINQTQCIRLNSSHDEIYMLYETFCFYRHKKQNANEIIMCLMQYILNEVAKRKTNNLTYKCNDNGPYSTYRRIYQVPSLHCFKFRKIIYEINYFLY